MRSEAEILLHKQEMESLLAGPLEVPKGYTRQEAEHSHRIASTCVELMDWILEIPGPYDEKVVGVAISANKLGEP